MTEFSAGEMRSVGEKLRRTLQNRSVAFMEVCGTHTMAIFRSGLRSLLPETVRLLSGPGCPVCVTDQGEIDMALSLAERGCIVLTYGDMLRVPGSAGSLLKLKGQGARVEIVTSATESLSAARDNPGSEVVFLGVGFETTAPATAVLLKLAREQELSNLSVLCLHKTVPPVMRALSANPALKIDGFILPGNVTVVTGLDEYAFLTDELKKAAVVAGFEPEAILGGILDLARQVTSGDFGIRVYRLRDVGKDGNRVAQNVLSEVFEPCDARWRGLGSIPQSGCRIRANYAAWDAERKFGLVPQTPKETKCRCGDVLSGLIDPPECGLFGSACTPVSPVGPCMVSSEGTCGAWYRYQ